MDAKERDNIIETWLDEQTVAATRTLATYTTMTPTCFADVHEIDDHLWHNYQTAQAAYETARAAILNNARAAEHTPHTNSTT